MNDPLEDTDDLERTARLDPPIDWIDVEWVDE